MRWVPAFFASLSVPAFYLLASRLLKNKSLASVSTLFFALTPRALSWFVMGGGLTRSPGQFFMLLTLATLIRLYEDNRRSDIFLAGFLGGLAVLSHPEAAVHTAVSAVFLWLMLSRKQTTFTDSDLCRACCLGCDRSLVGDRHSLSRSGSTPERRGNGIKNRRGVSSCLFYLYRRALCDFYRGSRVDWNRTSPRSPGLSAPVMDGDSFLCRRTQCRGSGIHSIGDACRYRVG